MSLMGTEEASYDNNLKKLGYADLAKPGGIDIYPIDFESKEHVIEILDGYNERMEADGEEDKVITYTDFVGTLMSSVTDIVNMISYVLGGVRGHLAGGKSSIMIGVITYISGARAQEGDRRPALHRRQQGRHQPRVQRRDHHRGLHRPASSASG